MLSVAHKRVQGCMSLHVHSVATEPAAFRGGGFCFRYPFEVVRSSTSTSLGLTVGWHSMRSQASHLYTRYSTPDSPWRSWMTNLRLPSQRRQDAGSRAGDSGMPSRDPRVWAAAAHRRDR